MKNSTGSVELTEPHGVLIDLGYGILLNCDQGIVILGDGRCLGGLDCGRVTLEETSSSDALGKYDRLSVSGNIGEDLTPTVMWTLYRDPPVLAVEMEIRNDGADDVIIDRLVLLRGTPPDGGFLGEFPARSCRYLAQPHYWPAHFQVLDYVPRLPEVGEATAYWSTVVGETRERSLAIGIGETATGGAGISFIGNEGRFGLELSSTLRTDLKNRMFRLRAGSSFGTQRMMLVPGNDPLDALDRYVDYACGYMERALRFPPYTGLFAAYGGNPSNGDPGLVPLGEERIEELMAVVERYLAPYGLDTIKTQFHGYSSSKPGDGPVRKMTSEEARDPEKVRNLVEEIREKAFAPEDYDSRADYPHGIGWHVAKLSEKGYRPALVSRPFYNVMAGTPSLDHAAARIYEMAVKDWGYRYLMVDFITADYDSDDDTMTVEQGIHNRLRAIREAVGDGVFIEACMVWPGPVLGIADGYRPAHDWRGGLEEDMAGTFACRYHLHGRFFQCDNEFFDPARRPFTWGKSGIEGMQSTEERVRLWTSYNAMLGYSCLTGGCLEKVEPERWHIFQRGIPSEPGRAIPLDFFEHSPPRLWLRKGSTPSGSHTVIGIFNWDNTAVLDARIETRDLQLNEDPECLFYDFWTGEVHGPAKSLPVMLPPFSHKIYQVHVVPSAPSLVGSTRHILGDLGILEWKCGKGEIHLHLEGAPARANNA